MNISPANIVETGYSQGYRFIIQKNQLPYSGFYHKDVRGNYWSGQTHTPESVLLNDIQPTVTLDSSYINKNNPVAAGFTSRFKENLDTPLLKSDFIKPTNADYTTGYFNRYFAQLRLSSSPGSDIFELNKENYDKLLNDSVSLKSYNTISIPWKIYGPLDDYYKGNIKLEDGIKTINLRIIKQAEKVIKNLSLYLNDPTQFAILNTPNVFVTPSITPIVTVREEIDLSPPDLSPPATPSITPSVTITPSITPTVTPTITITPSITPSITTTPSVTPSVTITSTASPSVTVTPTATPSETPSVTSTPTNTPTPSITRTPDRTVTPTPTTTQTPFPTRTPTSTPTISITPTTTPSLTSSVTPTATPSVTLSITVTPSVTNSVTPSITPTVTPSVTTTVGLTPSVTPSPSTLYCGSTISYAGGNAYPSTKTITIGPIIGTVNLNYIAYNVPDRFIVRYESSIVIDTGFVGAVDYDYGGINRTSFNSSLLGKIDPSTGLTYPNAGVTNAAPDGYPYVTSVSSGLVSFTKNTTTTFVEVDVYAPLPGTQWSYTLGCVIPPTPSNSPTPSVTPTITPTISVTPSITPSETPSITPSITPTTTPSETPSITPTTTPSNTPSNTPSTTPSVTSTPSVTPSETPSITPSGTPSTTPSVTSTPSVTPSNTPSITPTPSPSLSEGVSPSVTPTNTPSITVTPSNTPSVTPSETPSNTPSITSTPSITPSITSTPSNSATPSITPTITPSTSELVCDNNVFFTGGQTYPTTKTIKVGATTGLVNLNYNAYSVPDRFIMRFDGNMVIDTGYRGDPGYNFGGASRLSFTNALTGKIDPVTSLTYPNAGVTDAAPDGYPYIMGVGSGTIGFNKTTTSQYVEVDVYGPMAGTAWQFNVACPIPPSPSMTPSITPSVTPSITSTPSITVSVTPSITSTPSITVSVTPSITSTPSITPTSSVPCYNCGSSISDSYDGNDFITQTKPLCLSSAANGDTVFVSYEAYDRPNRFNIYADGFLVVTSGWVGTDTDYSGPWGGPGSITGPSFGTISFIYDNTKSYELRVDVGPADLTNILSDSWTVSITCSTTPPSPSISVTPSITPSISSISSYDVYLADKYECASCTVVQSSVLVAFPTGQSVVLNRWYPDINDISYSYKVLSASSGAGYILDVSFGSFTSCSESCAV